MRPFYTGERCRSSPRSLRIRRIKRTNPTGSSRCESRRSRNVVLASLLAGNEDPDHVRRQVLPLACVVRCRGVCCLGKGGKRELNAGMDRDMGMDMDTE